MESDTLFLEVIDEHAWLIKDKASPEIFCICGPYINQRVIRAMGGNLSQDQIVIHSPTTHHDAHWHHQGKSIHVSPNQVKEALNVDVEIGATCAFVMRDNLKIREEKGGCLLISDRNTAFWVNNIGSRFLKALGDCVQGSIIELHSRRLGITLQASIAFFRRLVMFGLYQPA